MAFEVMEDNDTEDHYVITLSFRPQGQFKGTPGREQFFIEKEGIIAHRQVLSLPLVDAGRRFPILPLTFGLVVAAIAGVIGIGFATGIFGEGKDGQVPEIGPAPTATSDTPAAAAVTPAPTALVAPAIISTIVTSTPMPTLTIAPEPKPTSTSTSTFVLAPNPIPSPVPTSTPVPTLIIAPESMPASAATLVPAPTPTPSLVSAPTPTSTLVPTASFNSGTSATATTTPNSYLALGPVAEQARLFADPILVNISRLQPDFEDDFSTNTGDWKARAVEADTQGTMIIRDGVMAISGLVGQMTVSRATWPASKDFVFEMDFRLVDGDPSSIQKIFFH